MIAVADSTIATLNPAQQQVVDLLGRVAGPRPSAVVDASVAAELLAELEEAVAPVAPHVEKSTLWVSKHGLSTVHGCEAHHVASLAEEFAWSVPTARGTVAHRAIELSIHWRGTAPPGVLVDEAIARLADDDRGIGVFLRSMGDGQLALLRGHAVDLVAKFLECFPPLKDHWWVRSESSVRLELLGGSIVLSGKVDLLLGRPRGSDPSKVIIDLKSGTPNIDHRNDMRFYALIETLRLGIPPRMLATYYLDSARAQPEEVSEPLLRAALHRTIDGIFAMVELHRLDRTPTKRPGSACRWCPLLPECEEGQASQRDRDDAW